MNSGKLISFEGTEGSGKTTLATQAVDFLQSKGIESVYVPDPGGTEVSLKIRELLLDPSQQISEITELLLFCASRSESVSTAIRPALENGVMIIADRYVDSTLAYQGYGRGISLADINTLNRIATGDLYPDLTFLLDLQVETGLERQLKQDRISEANLHFHRRVRQGYLEIAATEADRFCIIDASKPSDEVKRSVFKRLLAFCQ